MTPRPGRDLAAWRPHTGGAVLLVAICVVLAALLAGVVVQWAEGSGPTTTWQIGALAAVGALVVVALLAVRRDGHERKRLTRVDPVTGLGSRARLLDDLRQAAANPAGSALLVLVDVDGFTRVNETLGYTAGDLALNRLANRLRRALPESASCYRTFAGEFAIVSLGTDDLARPSLARRAAEALTEHRPGVELGARYGWATIPHEAHSAEDALRVASRRLSAAPRRAADAAAEATAVLARAIAERDHALELHLAGVAELAAAVARRLGLDEDDVSEIGRAARLLEIGMLTVPLAVLQRPGPLDDAELELVRRHTVAGERIMAAAPSLASCAALVRSSHERFGGGGYPDGLSGRSIPLGARVLSVCDAFAAMVTDRPYRRSLSYPAAVAELQRCAGTQFDPAIVAVLLDELEDETSLLADAV